MNAQYYLEIDPREFNRWLERSLTDNRLRLQSLMLQVLRIVIDEEARVWQMEFHAGAPIERALLDSTGIILRDEFKLADVIWKRTDDSGNAPRENVREKFSTKNISPAVKEIAGEEIASADKISAAEKFSDTGSSAQKKNSDIAVDLKANAPGTNSFNVPDEIPRDDNVVCASPQDDATQSDNPPISEAMQRLMDAAMKKLDKNGDSLPWGRSFKKAPRKLETITEEENNVVVEGTFVRYMDRDGVMQSFDERVLKTGKVVLVFSLADDTGGIFVKFFFENVDECYKVKKLLKPGQRLRVYGNVAPDRFNFYHMTMTPLGICEVKVAPREDRAPVKRVELHCHTRMSKMDALTPMTELVETAIRFGHKALAITDHGVVQAFPFCFDAVNDAHSDLKLIFGCEGYLISDEQGDELRENLPPKGGRIRPNHIIALCKNEIGLRNLYKLVSLGHLTYLNGTKNRARPCWPRTILQEHRDGLILGSACEAGELYRAIERWMENDKRAESDRVTEEDLLRIADFYDYLEIQPLGNNMFLTRSYKDAPPRFTEDQLKQMNRKVIELGRKHGKLTVATCDVHILNPEDTKLRAILQFSQGFPDADNQAPLYYRTTEEMLAEFSYLGKDLAEEVVITNPNKIAEQIERFRPVPDRDQLYSPVIPGAEEKIAQLSYARAHELYGTPLPQLVEDRLKMELDSIINHGYAVLYYIAHRLVKKSLDDGYLVGSRGSVGSSLVATMTDITEVNPLVPHYRCPKCRHCEFFTHNEYDSGFDMEPKNCPECGEPMVRDGHNIPFAVFMGFHGDKVPDIDLNFSGVYQPVAHKFCEELFGRDNVCRAGTIATVQPKTAKSYVYKYFEAKGIERDKLHPAFADSFLEGLNGVKRTTGQHPGGIMVIPRNLDIHYITPMSHPADERASNTVTTHYDYHSINDRLVKLDILGHDDPTVIKMLEELTGLNARRDIPIGDEATMAIFYKGPEALGVTEEQIHTRTATYGIPECGTNFTMGMIDELKPHKFSEIVRISGYSHGTDVWLNNAQDLIRAGHSKYETISTRDDIMTTLIAKGVKPIIAFKTMEYCRKGKAAKKGKLEPEMQEAMEKAGVPDWYIRSCVTVKYLFPKAHAVAYVLMAYRIAYCKVHYPKAYYAAYFTVRAPSFDAGKIRGGVSAVWKFISDVRQQGVRAKPGDKETMLYMEVVLECLQRGIKIEDIDLYKSDATRFVITEKGIRPPLSALDGVGESAALALARGRDVNTPFLSQEDIRLRCGVGQSVLDKLAAYGALGDLPDSNQLSLF